MYSFNSVSVSLFKFVCLAVVLCVSAAPQLQQQGQVEQQQGNVNAAVEPLQAGAEDGKDLKGSNSYGYGYYGGYPGFGGGFGSPYYSGYGYSNYYGYPYYRNFGGLYGGYWY